MGSLVKSGTSHRIAQVPLGKSLVQEMRAEAVQASPGLLASEVRKLLYSIPGERVLLSLECVS